MKKSLLAILFVGVLALVPLTARAATFRVPDGGTATITDSVKNLYTAGNVITTDAKILGDLVAVGNTINVNQNVEHSLFAAGQSVVIKGDVGQNARLAGNTITIIGKVGEDLMAAGANIVIDKNSTVASDAFLAGSSITIDGPIGGQLKAGADTFKLNSAVKGDVYAEGTTIELGPNANIGGKLTYKSDTPAGIDTNAKVTGGIEYIKKSKYNNAFTTVLMTEILTLGMLSKLIGSILLLLVIIYLMPKVSKEITDGVIRQPVPTLGIGFLTLVAVPIVLILLLVSMIGSQIAWVAGILYLLMLVLAGNYMTVLVGHLAQKIFGKTKELKINWTTVVIGVIVSAIITLIPFIGPLALFIAFLMTLGSITKLALGLRGKI